MENESKTKICETMNNNNSVVNINININPESTKTCIKCKKLKPITDFINESKVLKTCKFCCDKMSEYKKTKYKCSHGKQRNQCRECGGVSFCTHGKRRNIFVDCGGSFYLQHDKQRQTCKICDEVGHLAGIVRSRVYSALKSNKSDHFC